MTALPQPTFRALADPTRREILTLLSRGPMTIAEVTQHFTMTRAAVKKHLNVLREGDLIAVTPRGRERFNHIRPEGFAPVMDWLGFFDSFWDNRLSNLKAAIENSQSKDTSND